MIDRDDQIFYNVLCVIEKSNAILLTLLYMREPLQSQKPLGATLLFQIKIIYHP